MDIHYNAFISYRHHPDDIRAAQEIHRALERFKIPKAIKKKTRAQTPMRLFRDREELPITSDLSGDISAALEDADFLIVICSVHTKESLWVQREIETFLKSHPKNRVLTLLVNGEPYEVIPEILLYDEYTDPLTGEKTRRDIEPLSCDWRMKKKQAMQEELPRLAAALLGCGYDELRQRQRQYRMRRLTAFFSAVLVASLSLTAYFIHTGIKIKQSLDEALRNQSMHLATASEERMDDGDRLTAIALAREALPSAENDRPYVARAEFALSESLGVYDMEHRLSAVCTLRPGALVDSFRLSPDESLLCILDQRGRFSIWDTASYMKLAEIDPDVDYITDYFFLADNSLAVLTDNMDSELRLYSPSGELLRSLPGGTYMALYGDMGILLMRYSLEHDCYGLHFVGADGEEMREPVFYPDDENGMELMGLLSDKYEENAPIALRFKNYEGYELRLAWPETGELKTAVSNENFISEVSYGPSGRIYAIVSDGSGYYNGSYMDMRISSPARNDVYCIDGESASIIWQSEITTHVYSELETVCEVPGGKTVLCQTGNTLELLDYDTGAVISACQTETSIICLDVYGHEAMFTLRDGSRGLYSYADNQCSAIKYMEDGIIQSAATADGRHFTHVFMGTQVTVYDLLPAVNSWEADIGGYFYCKASLAAGDNILVAASGSLFLFDPVEKETLWRRETSYSEELLGLSPDESEAYSAEYEELVITSLADGSERRITLPELPQEYYSSYPNENYRLIGDMLYYTLESVQGEFLLEYDIKAASHRYWQLSEYPDGKKQYTYSDILPGAENSLILKSPDGQISEFDLGTGEIKLLAEDVSAAPATAASEDGRFAWSVGNVIYLRDAKGGEIEIDTGVPRTVSMYFYGDTLLALGDDGDLRFFDLEGKQLASDSLTIFNTFYRDAESYRSGDLSISWQPMPDGKIALKVFGAMNVIDGESCGVCAYVLYCEQYHERLNEFICISDSKFVAFKCYSLSELRVIAAGQLGGFTLTEEQKISYGIE